MSPTHAEPVTSGLPAAAASAPADLRAPLRLSVTRGVLGLELYERVKLGPLEIEELALTLPNLSFPVDLSGGVPTFRHRRGRLARLELTLSLELLARWVAPRLRALTQGPPELRLWGFDQGIGVGLHGPRSALAFDLLWAPVDHTLRLVVANARGVGLPGPILGHVLRALDSTLGGRGSRRGRVVTLDHAARGILREVLPNAGARVPDASGARPGPLRIEGDRVEVCFDDVSLPAELSDSACRALELAGLVTAADDALAEGRLEEARAGYLEALERAPRHREISRIVAEIDVAHVGRSESALGLLVDAESALHAGAVAAELLAAVGDRDGATAALAEAVAREPYGPLAARLGLRLAELATDAGARQAALDEAVARAPALEAVRWVRAEARLDLGDVAGALGDMEHVEASLRGARARHAACRRCAALLQSAGFARQAGQWFERALRYVGDDPFATAGLGRALIATGRAARGVALLERSVELGEAAGEGDPDAALDLGRLLADEYRDLPAAIARVRTVTASSTRVVEARALEARWRVALGDIAGASLAHARTRDAIEVAGRRDPRWSAWLLEAARFEREVQRDHYAAERHLIVALRLAPQDQEVGRTFREVAAVTARLRRNPSNGEAPSEPSHGDAAPAAAPDGAEPAPVEEPGGRPRAVFNFDDPEGEDSGPDAALAGVADELQRLEGALRANPEDGDVALRMAELLERSGRDAELFALLSARLEDAADAERARLLPLARAVLWRLEQRARQLGRSGEESLYAAFRQRFSLD